MVYVIRAVGTDFYKIGYTGGSIEARIRQLAPGCPHELMVFCRIEGGRALETELHKRLGEFRVRNEWFWLSGDKVQFLLDLSVFHPWKP